MLVVVVTMFAIPAAATDGKLDRLRKTAGQSAEGNVTLVAESDGSFTQPATGGGTLDCSLHDMVYDEAGFVFGPDLSQPAGELVEEEWYWLACVNAGGQTVVARAFQYLPGESVIAPADLAERAREELAILYPEPRTSPDVAFDQLVGLDTWMWIDPALWEPISATASITGLSVSATATPSHVTWDMGDGSDPVVCEGPGEAYDKSREPEHQSTDCWHLYQYAGEYAASAMVTWTVEWSASDGSGGSLADVERTTEFPMTVLEHQAVGT